MPGCGEPHDSRGYCAGHAYRLRKYGDPLAETSRISPGVAFKFLLESIKDPLPDGCIIWPYGGCKLGYGSIRYEGRSW